MCVFCAMYRHVMPVNSEQAQLINMLRSRRPTHPAMFPGYVTFALCLAICINRCIVLFQVVCDAMICGHCSSTKLIVIEVVVVAGRTADLLFAVNRTSRSAKLAPGALQIGLLLLLFCYY